MNVWILLEFCGDLWILGDFWDSNKFWYSCLECSFVVFFKWITRSSLGKIKIKGGILFFPTSSRVILFLLSFLT